tara:strand:- start:3582 stop:4274 length:693 start_codon:yes stop_codon:yes gene_type:complete
MEIYVDNRERDLIKLFNENKNDIILKNLEIGDIVYKKDGEVIYIVERKTFNDLGASINDGRYKEQKIRLLSNSNGNLFYILEGNMSECTTLNQKALLGSIVNMTFRDNIKLIFSSDINQTYKILVQIKDKFNSGKFSKIVGVSNDNNNYVSSIKLNKKENMTKLNCNIIQLATIPGVSKNMSSIILEKYNTIDKLIEEYKKEGEDMLAELSMGKRKLGKILSKKIYDILI